MLNTSAHILLCFFLSTCCSLVFLLPHSTPISCFFPFLFFALRAEIFRYLISFVGKIEALRFPQNISRPCPSSSDPRREPRSLTTRSAKPSFKNLRKSKRKKENKKQKKPRKKERRRRSAKGRRRRRPTKTLSTKTSTTNSRSSTPNSYPPFTACLSYLRIFIERKYLSKNA